MKQNTRAKLSVFLVLVLTLSAIFHASAHFEASAQKNIPQELMPCAASYCENLSLYSDIPEAMPCSPANGTEQLLIPGGIPFGVKFNTDGVLVVGFCDIETDKGKINPAYAAGLRAGDVIHQLNGHPISDAAGLSRAMDEGKGQPFTVTFTRENREHTVTVTPAYSVSDEKYKSGIWIRDSGAGIGTVTFIDPNSGMFGGLGHGICDSDTGKLIPMERGTVMDVTISGIIRGLPGTPGEVKGYFNSEKLGSVFGNTECGVFGIFSKIPSECGKVIPTASRGEVHEGKAEILCSLDTDTVTRYEVSISAINPTAESNKCFTVTVTDPALIAKTGGIVQGMSGSPIIQDGKLIGAITHVLINDPTRGYGIFIENMLNAAQMPMEKAS